MPKEESYILSKKPSSPTTETGNKNTIGCDSFPAPRSVLCSGGKTLYVTRKMQGAYFSFPFSTAPVGSIPTITKSYSPGGFTNPFGFARNTGPASFSQMAEWKLTWPDGTVLVGNSALSFAVARSPISKKDPVNSG